MSRILFHILGTLRKVWVRIVAFALLAVLTAVLAQIIGPLLQQDISGQLGADAVEDILSILTSSMLAVTTFSLSVAVSAFAAAASSATPRATSVLQEDPTTQNVLATFLGAFLYGLIGLIGLKAQLYDDAGRLVLFVVTVGVVGLVVIALIRWIDHLMVFGRMGDTLGRIEKAATKALKERLENPFLGGRSAAEHLPDTGQRVGARKTGYIQHIDMAALQDCAEAIGGRVHLLCLPGSFIAETAPVLLLEGAHLPEDQAAKLAKAITIGDARTFREDPRFGIIVLTEIASRTLSPAVNDPGTAIDVIGRHLRILSLWREPVAAEPDYPDVLVPRITAQDLIEDAFRPIARDGAGLVEVQIRLQKILTAVQNAAPAAFEAPVKAMRCYALVQAKAATMAEPDLTALQDVMQQERA